MIRASVLLVALFALLLQGCSNGDDFQNDRRRVEEALNALATNLVENRPADVAAYTERLGRHVESNPSFFGSAVALVDEAGEVIASPYVYRTAEGLATKDLATPSYGIKSQEWFAAPIAADEGIWSEPYFDTGGGEIWMITRSVPVRDSRGVFAVVTTDLEVDAPSR